MNRGHPEVSCLYLQVPWHGDMLPVKATSVTRKNSGGELEEDKMRQRETEPAAPEDSPYASPRYHGGKSGDRVSGASTTWMYYVCAHGLILALTCIWIVAPKLIPGPVFLIVGWLVNACAMLIGPSIAVSLVLCVVALKRRGSLLILALADVCISTAHLIVALPAVTD